ncbi:MAG: TonB-dependent receptor [Bacteroidota bacterium]
MRLSIYLSVFFISFLSLSQTTISGKVFDSKNLPIQGANVYLEGTYDGATSDENGNFSFTTEEKGTQVLIISFMSYETRNIAGDVSTLNNLEVKLKDDLEALDTVVISAGTFEANDNSKVSVLSSLDVVTTASAVGDFVGALQTLPGTSTNAEDGRLFIRGGSAEENQIFIDGIRVFTPFNPTPGNVPTRSRYSPFLFDGITFSTGGYSAEYGNGLSGVTLLNTIDEPDQEKTEIGVLSLGAQLGRTEKWEKSSLSFNAGYYNFSPYIALFPERNDWIEPIESAAGEAVFRQKFNSGLLKVYAAFDTSNFELIQDDINNPEGLRFGLNNNNFYTNASYQGTLVNGWSLNTGLSYTIANTKTRIDVLNFDNDENSAHVKLKLRKRFNSRFKVSFGAEHFSTDFDETFNDGNFSPQYGFTDDNTGLFVESDIIFNKNLALKAGLRADNYQLSNQFEIAPRASLAYKTSKNAQVSVAYGSFFQNPTNDILRFRSDLNPENAQHYIMNYQYVNDGKIFRAELYRKDYNNLVKFDSEFPMINSDYTNDGEGFAQGIDLFWRDNKSIKNLDYWFSYSYLDTERDFRNFPVAAQPNFAVNHNASIVGKYWIDAWKSQLGMDYTFASGRTFNNPNTDQFLAEKTKSFNSISLNWAYLIDQQKILYLSVNNVLGFQNVVNYQYTNTPDANGVFNRRAIQPSADSFFFVGFFWTISEDGTDNQLDNL